MEQQENVNTNLNLTLKEKFKFSLHPLPNYLNIIEKILNLEYYF